jgi:hypothetical protein
MFPLQIMDSLLKLKLEMVFRGIPLEQARQRFEELKSAPPTESKEAKVVKRRKLKLGTSDKK